MFKKMFAVLGFVFFMGVVCYVGYTESEYTRTATVVDWYDEVDGRVVVLEDSTGNQWEYILENKGYSIGDEVRMTMFDNNTTHDVYDDIIEGIELVHK